jgi:hypothetical protein
MKSGEWIKVWVKVMAFHILLGQIGVNIFNFSCYCKSKIETSLMPHTQVCGSTSPLTQSCCSDQENCHLQTHQAEKNNCGKNKTEYKKAPLVGQLVEHEFHFFPCIPPNLEQALPFIQNGSTKRSLTSYNPFSLNSSSGRFKRILHCSLNC